MYNPDRCFKIPADCRAILGVLWLATVTLLAVDSLDGHPGIMAAWAVLGGCAAAAWTCILVHEYSRRILLDVMSFEHRQQTPMMDEPDRALTSLGL